MAVPPHKPETSPMIERIELRDGGWLLYDPQFFAADESAAIFTELREKLEWHQVFTRGIPFPRLIAYLADDGVKYSYSGVSHAPAPWTPITLDIKQRVEAASESVFNSLLLNLYRHGKDSMGYHTDYDSQVGPNPVIASVTFGAVRRFVMKHVKSGEKMSFELENGSLLVMGGTSQHYYHHAVPKTEVEIGERINLTFRYLR